MRDYRPLSQQLEELLTEYLPEGGIHSHVAAQKLGLSPRTMARRLSKEGTTYLEVVQRLRMKLTEQYLMDERVPLADVSWRLGFEEQSSFSHACKRWFGKTPGELRRGTLSEAA